MTSGSGLLPLVLLAHMLNSNAAVLSLLLCLPLVQKNKISKDAFHATHGNTADPLHRTFSDGI